MYSLIFGLSRQSKYVVMILGDVVLVICSVYLAFVMRYNTLFPFDDASVPTGFPALLGGVGIAICYAMGLQRIKLHSLENQAILRIGASAFFFAIAASVLGFLFYFATPISIALTIGAVFFVISVLGRLGVLKLLNWLGQLDETRASVAVYGAGSAGVQLVSALRQTSVVKPVVFVDDNASLWGFIVSGLTVERPSKLKKMVQKGFVRKVIIAMPSVSQTRQNELIGELADLGCEVQILPSFVELISGKPLAGGLRTVKPDELLGRDKVDLAIPDVAKAYAGRVVMVTGAGGSIGSELCQQLINCAPARIVLFEQSEFSLYEIDGELRSMAKQAGIEVTSRLGSITNPARVRKIMIGEKVEIVLHAAAYKHVPIVEENELEGARNNVLGTQIVADAAVAAGVERFILISTDKAVRPTNIMGATKRMAELVVQDMQTRATETKFAMVRFGNVLGSSGSVLPLFQKQIMAGGPVTVTHPEITRFFMTIPEAARLVLLAGAYAEGGDVFVLDLGQPMKIIDIARRMIEMSGRRVKENGAGDIEIIITGMRPGEKLYEELLIDDDSLLPTPHEKILRAQEAMLSQIEVAAMIKDIRDAVEHGDVDALRAVIARRVDGYHTAGDSGRGQVV